jgi:hypothetical protein
VNTCLHLTAHSGSAEIAKLILDAGGLGLKVFACIPYLGIHFMVDMKLLNCYCSMAPTSILILKDGDYEKKSVVLDVVEQILMGGEDKEENERFIQTRNILVKQRL